MNGLKKVWEQERYYCLIAVLMGVVFTALFTAYTSKSYAEEIQNGISDKVVRFHVLANSDELEDQTLKLLVRDKILSVYGNILSVCEDKADTLKKLEQEQNNIRLLAQETVWEQGYTYAVSVSVIQEHFPFKQYEDVVFPAGIYDGLRIEIGEAVGENWWCVLYPQMCYVDATLGYSTSESYELLENTLSEEELIVVSAMTQEQVIPKLKWKIVEWWQSKGE